MEGEYKEIDLQSITLSKSCLVSPRNPACRSSKIVKQADDRGSVKNVVSDVGRNFLRNSFKRKHGGVVVPSERIRRHNAHVGIAACGVTRSWRLNSDDLHPFHLQ